MITADVRGAARGQGLFADKLYFFKGAQYWRYDLKKDYGEVDYPQPLSAWNLPGDFARGIDACLPGARAFVGKTYFFRGALYTSYDWKTQRASDPKPLANWSSNRPFPFPGGIDAALEGAGPFAGKAYFFKGSKYARYDWKEDDIDLVDQSIAAWKLGERFAADISACVSATEGSLPSTPVAYFFKGGEYVKYDWKTGAAREGYPLPIAAAWPTGCAVWAAHSQAPTLVCDDPRLDAGRNRVAVYPFGPTSGQAGWQASVKFVDIKELASTLTALMIPEWYGDDGAGKNKVPRGRITRLALNAHGMPGVFAANGPNAMSKHETEGINDMKLLADEALRANLVRIASMLAPDASILLVGCQAGQQLVGSDFLISFSNVMRGHPVTAFTGIGYAGGPRSARDGKCSEAGMRDTNFLSGSRGGEEEGQRVAQYWNNLVEWPWACETSPGAKTALNGEITRRPPRDKAI
jgi:Hemopexin